MLCLVLSAVVAFTTAAASSLVQNWVLLIMFIYNRNCKTDLGRASFCWSYFTFTPPTSNSNNKKSIRYLFYFVCIICPNSTIKKYNHINYKQQVYNFLFHFSFFSVLFSLPVSCVQWWSGTRQAWWYCGYPEPGNVKIFQQHRQRWPLAV